MVSLGMFVVSCGESKKEAPKDIEKTEVGEQNTDAMEADSHDHSEDMAAAVYQCPMKCEGEKTYAEEGTCPECKMKLKELAPSEE